MLCKCLCYFESQQICPFPFRPAPRVTWKKAGGSLPGGRYDDQDEYGTLLRITDVKWEDEAEYVCTGTNTEGSKTYTIRVDVECKVANK